VIPLNAPINATPTPGTSANSNNNNFSGRTVEASDRAPTSSSPPAPLYSAPQPQASSNTPPSNAGSAVATPAPAAPAPVAAVNVTPAKLVKRVTPVAPMGVSRRTSGSVMVKFNIGTNGRVTDVEVVDSTPPGIFDDAAQAAVRKWVYEPRKENGVAVESTARARLVFEAE
jgi:periplasmic protein TonB